MPMSDRILPLCDVLLGAAYADEVLREEEKAEIKASIAELAGGLPPEVEARIAGFEPKGFDLAAAAEPFKADPIEDRRKLVQLVAAVTESDDEIDLAEDEYVRALAKALDLPDSELDGIAIDVETEELVETFAKVRKGPPPPPPKK